jgi:hypothetical protein
MKTLVKLLVLLCLLAGVSEVRSGTVRQGTVLLNMTVVNICLADTDTIAVTNHLNFKRFLWQVRNNSAWESANDFSPELFPHDKKYYLPVIGDSLLAGKAIRCLADTNLTGSYSDTSAVVPVMIYYPISGTGTISGAFKCCFGQQTLFYSVSGYLNVTSYEWSLPSWAHITEHTNNFDSITISGSAPETGGDTLVSVTPQNANCGPGVKCSKLLKIIGKVGGFNPTISGPDFLCKNKGMSYSVGGVTNATQYHWIVPSWASIQSASPDSMSIILIANTQSTGNISVMPYNSCDSGDIILKNISVYGELTSGVISSPDSIICFNTQPGILHFSSPPSGADGDYHYQWQDSTVTSIWEILPFATSPVYQPDTLEVTHYYRVLVSSDLCGGAVSTNSVKVFVFPQNLTATIGDEQAICANEQPGILHSINPAISAPGLYNYQWYSSANQTTWLPVANAHDSIYQPPLLTQNTYYRLKITTLNNCDSAISPAIKITVNPLPLAASILGEFNVCRNQHDVLYEVDPLTDGYLYSWSLKKNLGSFVTGQSTNKTYIKWGNVSGTDTLYLTQNIVSTNCSNNSHTVIHVLSSTAPERTQIIRKPNSNMLICADSSVNLHYNWGFIPKATQLPEFIPGATNRYVILPHAFDTITYNYFVDTYYEASCTTRSYISPYNLPIGVNELIATENVPLVFPNPSKGVINILLSDNYLKTDINIRLYDLAGRLHLSTIVSSSKLISLTLPPDLQQGLYIIQLFSATNPVFTTRLTIIK